MSDAVASRRVTRPPVRGRCVRAVGRESLGQTARDEVQLKHSRNQDQPATHLELDKSDKPNQVALGMTLSLTAGTDDAA